MNTIIQNYSNLSISKSKIKLNIKDLIKEKQLAIEKHDCIVEIVNN